jgi:hypothetical protein
MAAAAPADALLGLAFSQAVSSFRFFAGIVLLAKSTNGNVTTGEIGTKSLKAWAAAGADLHAT